MTGLLQAGLAPGAISDAIIDTPQGPMCAIVARPAASAAACPAVITFPHVGGLTDTMRLMAQQVSTGGFVCVVPDLYHRLGTIVIDPQSENADVVAIRKIAAASITEPGAMEDTRAVLRWLEGQPYVRGPGCATIGYGRGGGLAILAASVFPDTIRAAASMLGFGITASGRDIAKAWLTKIKAPIYCAFAEDDDIIPASVPAELASVLAELPIDARLVIHPGARHPYVFPDRTIYDPAAAGRDWDAIFAMFAQRLAEDPQ
jgi:carboxymethylenebutenolidase